MKLVILIYLSLFLTVGFCTYPISKFGGRAFSVKPSSGMYQLGNLGINNITGGQEIVAYGDVNNDKWTDIMTVTDDKKNLTVHIYNKNTFSFWDFVTIIPGEEIVSVTTGDFNFDGKLDLLLTVNSTGKLVVKYFFRTDETPFFGSAVNKENKSFELPDAAQPFVLDSNGNRRLDVMYYDPSTKKRTLKTFNSTTNDFMTTYMDDFVSKGDGCIPFVGSEVQFNAFSKPHSNSFADFNGDCAADLLITTTDGEDDYIEIWLRNPADSLFCLVNVTKITEEISPITIADMNNNGRLDLVFAIYDAAKPPALNVVYNTFAANIEKPCVASDSKMRSPFNSATFLSKTNSSENKIYEMPAMYNGTQLFTTNPEQRPGRIRAGDINIDGYPDLLFIVYDPTADDTTSGSIVLAMNQVGDNGNDLIFWSNVSNGISSDNHAYFQLQESSDSNITVIKATSASFFDFHELGKLGLWVSTKDNVNATTQLTGIMNFVSTEYFILKALGLNGFEPADKNSINGALGGVYYGATMECIVTDINGNNRLSKVAQIPQSAYTPLELPYMFLGLGRTNNYVENFTMGISRKDNATDRQISYWTTIIPNSQLIVNPRIAKTWTLDIFANPISEAFLIGLVTGIILLILGGFIIYLHRQEKAEDIANQDRMIHIFG